jgi:fido (protein-threonine AMPylation protein)
MACEWHREAHQGLHIPVPYYAGEIRDADPRFPCLIGYEVRVGAAPGVPSADVPAELDFFEQAMQRATASLDSAFPRDYVLTDVDELREVLTLCAIAHGEWVRIHPFANGNGRTARLWANWCALRYGLPPFVRLRPRPAHPGYGQAAAASMRGNHEPMENVFVDMLLNLPS